MIPTTRLPRDKDGRITETLSAGEVKRLIAQMKEETYPRRPAPEKRGPPTRENPKGPIIEWPRMPPKPRPDRNKTTNTPLARTLNGNGEYRSDLEKLSRLSGGTTYRTPEAGRTTKRSGITIDDIAASLGYVKDPLDQRMALALAVHTIAEWPAIEELAHAPLLKQLMGSHNTKKLVMGKMRHRTRMILCEVFHDLALLRFPLATKPAAAALKMTQRDYRELYQSTAGFLETRANAGAYAACEALYGDE